MKPASPAARLACVLLAALIALPLQLIANEIAKSIEMLRRQGFPITFQNGNYYVKTPGGSIPMTSGMTFTYERDSNGRSQLSIKRPGAEGMTETISLPGVEGPRFNKSMGISPSAGASAGCMAGMCFDMNALKGMGRDLPYQPLPGSPQSGPYLMSDNALLNAAIAQCRVVPASPEAQNFIRDLQAATLAAKAAAKPDDVITRESQDYLASTLKQFIDTPLSAIPLEAHPTPYPAGSNHQRLDADLEGIKSAIVNANPIDGARAAGKVARKLKFLEEHLDLPGARAERDYLARELRRLSVDQQGFLKGLMFAKAPAYAFGTKATSDEGLRIRASANQLLAAQESAMFGCKGLSESKPETAAKCGVIAQRSEELMAAHALADRMAVSGNHTGFDSVMSGLERTTSAAAEVANGFSTGVLSSLEGMVDGVVQILSHPIDTANGLYQAIANYDQTWEQVKGHVAGKAQTLVHGTLEERAQIVGELTAEIVTSIAGAGLAAKLPKAGTIAQAVGRAATRAAVEELTEAAVAAGTISRGFATNFKTLSANWPDASAAILRSRSPLPALEPKALEGLKRLERLLPNQVEGGLIKDTDRALHLGKLAESKLSVTEQVSSAPYSPWRAKPTNGSAPQYTLAELKQLVETLDVDPRGKQSVFYSGAGRQAREFADGAPHLRTTLEQTPGGKYFDELNLTPQKFKEWDWPEEQWEKLAGRLSARFAEASRGHTYYFVDIGYGRFVDGDSIFEKFELAALLNNKEVTHIEAAIIKGATR